MTNGDKPPELSRHPLVVWLSLIVLLLCMVAIVGVDSKREIIPPLRVKSGRPAAIKPARSIARSATSKQVPSELAGTPLIRVNVTPGGEATLLLEVRGSYSIRPVGASRELGSGNSLASSKVESTVAGLKIGNSKYPVTSLEIVPRQDPSIRVNNHLYRGTMRLYRRKDGQVSAVNVLPLESYLASVVDSEMPAAFPDAARRAQAIVSRTYALYQMKHADPAAVYDLFSSQRSQKYLGVEYTTDAGRRLAGESESSRRAVADTQRLICAQRGEPFCTYYSAVCGGQTTNGSEIFSDASPLLKSVPCDWCRDSEYYRWTVAFDRAEFLRKTESLGVPIALSSIRQTTGPGQGEISRFRMTDGKRSVEATGTDLRDRLVLRSPHFSLKLNQGQVHADGRGHGHGVGFCQWGARGQALIGKTAPEIIRHYYPGTELVKY